MKNLFLFTSLILCLSGCMAIKESFVNPETGEKIAGYDNDCVFQIGKTDREEVGADNKMGVALTFEDSINQKIPVGKLVAVGAYPSVVTKKGLKVGDPVSKARLIYGKPKAKIIDYGMDANGYVWWIFHGLFYGNFTILTDESYDKVLEIIIGRPRLFDLKLQKKHLR